MGSTKFEGGLLQSVYKWNKLNYPQTQDYNYLQRITSVTMFTQFTNRYKDTSMRYRDIQLRYTDISM